MFNKILIANRGEIAVRIARACRQMGILAVAVYSDVDKEALHVRSSDEAYHIGPSPAAESYLRGDKIIQVALEAGCEAIHPGYGFLSENAAFARAVTDARLVWIGPPPEAIDLMGSKIDSKLLAQRLGVPTVPGYNGEDQSAERLTEEANRIGYPVLIKASAGGGGKGMRVVRDSASMAESVQAAQREALSAFGDAAVLLEKYLERPRHIEVQVLGDNFGKLVHLGERECSIQRRHQKVLEESPSPIVTPEMREQITTWALSLAKAAGYTNAGTVEFIYQDGQFYFLEMNTRLQVEHPVTEEATGIDLVTAQIRIAAGEALWFRQEDVRLDKHGIEVRLYAEDPEHEFLPSTGKIAHFSCPRGVRLDTGYTAGDWIPQYYDPQIAKLIVSGKDRTDAVNAIAFALGESKIEGPRTNLDFLRWLVSFPEFRAGNLSTNFIDEYYSPGALALAPAPVVIGAGALLALCWRKPPANQTGSPFQAGGWRQAGQAIMASPVVSGVEYRCVFSAQAGKPGCWQVSASHGADEVYTGQVSLSFGDLERRRARRVGGVLQLQLDGEAAEYVMPFLFTADGRDGVLDFGSQSFAFEQAPALSTERLNPAVHLKNEDTLESPMPGKVLKVLIAEGEQVEESQPLLIIEAMKMEFVVRAPHDGTVATIHYPEGSQVAVGDVLAEMKK